MCDGMALLDVRRILDIGLPVLALSVWSGTGFADDDAP
jgi:hypothetical protein